MGQISEFRFQHTTRVTFGPGTLSTLGDEITTLGGTRALVVCDPGIIEAGLSGRVLAQLAPGGIAAEVFSEVSPNPRDAECCAAAAAAVEAKADVIIGLGGGSAMDTAKAAAALATNGGTVKDWEDPRRLDREPLPLVCIPTTAGTGSEVTFVAVITDELNHYKMTLLDPRIAPCLAIADPQLTLSLPPGLTAATGMDALTHAIEAYTCQVASPITDGMALPAIRLIAANLRAAVGDGGDLGARSAMLLASTMAGMAFGNSDVGAVHCIGESVGGLYDTPHGVANAVFLPYVFRFNVSANPAKHADVARALGVDTLSADPTAVALQGATAIEELMADVGLPRLRDVSGIEPADFERLARMSSEHVCSPDNAREITEADYLMILRDAYGS